MPAAWIYLTTALLLFGIAVVGFILTHHLVRKVLALNVIATAVFLLLVVLAYGGGGPDPDPVPHALVLTGIVVSFSASALALGLARRIHDATGHSHLPEEEA